MAEPWEIDWGGQPQRRPGLGGATAPRSLEDAPGYMRAFEAGRRISQPQPWEMEWEAPPANEAKDSPTPEGPQRSIWQRFSDAYSDAGSYSWMGELAGQIADFTDYGMGDEAMAGAVPGFAAMSPEQKEAARDAMRVQAVRDQRAAAHARNEADPLWRQGETLWDAAASGRWLPRLAGEVFGGADPTYLLAPGSSAAKRIAAQAAIQGTSDVALQGVDLAQGEQDEFSPLRAGLSAALGGGFQGGVEGLRYLFRPRAKPGEGGDPIVDGTLDEATAARAIEIDETLRSAGVDPATFSSPELAAAAAERIAAARARQPNVSDVFGDAAEGARRGSIWEAIDRGDTDRSFGPTPESRAIGDIAGPDIAALRAAAEAAEGTPAYPAAVQAFLDAMNGRVERTIIAAPEGNVRSDDAGGIAGLDRKRAADEAVGERAQAARGDDPLLDTILDANVPNDVKMGRLWQRIEEMQRGRGEEPELPLDLDIPSAPWTAPTPDAARARAQPPRPAGGPDDMTRFIMEDLEGGGKAVTDSGGATRFGISQKGNPDVNIAGLTEAKARQLYQDRYWGKVAKEGEGMSPETQLILYDAAINHGPETAKKMLRAAGDNPAGFMALRRAEYARLIKENPGKYKQYEKGWENRLKKIERRNGTTGGGAAPESTYRAPDLTETGTPRDPLREREGQFERDSARRSPTDAEYDAGKVFPDRDGNFREGDPRREQPFQQDAAPQTRQEPYRAVTDDPEGQPGYWERESQRMQDEFAERMRAAEKEAKASAGGRYERERTSANDDVRSRYREKYDQSPERAGEFWRTTDDGYVAGKAGNPVAFRSAKEAAKWAAKNRMAGDFDLVSWGATGRNQTQRVVLKRRDNSTYGARADEAAQEPAQPGAAAPEVDATGFRQPRTDFERQAPPAGRSADASQRTLEGPENAPPARDEPPPVSGATEPPIARPEAPGGTGGAVSPPVAPQSVRPAAAAESRTPVSGERERVVTPRGTEVDTQFEVREARDLVTSDNPAFDPALQPRQRGARASSDAQIAEIASNLDPAQLGSTRVASSGAPIVGRDRGVDSGNGRVMALRRAYELHPEKAAEYRKMIESRGLSTEGFDQPILVRRHDLDGEERVRFAREANEDATMRMSSTEQARVDAGTMSDGTLGSYRGGAVTDAGNRDFVRGWMDEVVSPAERNAMIGRDGTISAEGVRRLQGSLLARAFDDPNLVAKIVEDPEPNIKAIGNALIEAAPAFAQVRARVAAGDLAPEFDISKQIGEMASIISRARAEKKPVGDYLDQGDMLGKGPDPITDALTRLMFRGENLKQARGGAAVSDGLRFYADEALNLQGGKGMFGDAIPDMKPLDILTFARERLDAKLRRDEGQSDMFSAKNVGRGFIEDGGPTPLLENLRGRLAAIASGDGVDAALARRLAAIVDQDATVRYGPDQISDPTARGEFVDGEKGIRVRAYDDVESVLHEAIHLGAISRYGWSFENAKLNGPEGRAVVDLLRVFNDAKAQAGRGGRRLQSAELNHALSNPDEFLAMSLTSPKVQKFLERGTLWDRVIDTVRGLVGLPKKFTPLLERAVKAGTAVLDGAKPEPVAAGFGRAQPRRAFNPGDDPRGGILSKIIDTEGLSRDAAGIRAAVGDPKGTLKKIMQRAHDGAAWTFFSEDARGRALAGRYDSAAMNDYLDNFFAPPGKLDGKAVGRDYHSAVQRFGMGRSNQALGALEPFANNKAALERIAGLLRFPNRRTGATAKEREAAQTLSKMLKETIEYRKKAGETIGEVTDGYLPRVPSVDKIVAERDAFLKAATELYRRHGVKDPAAAADNWFQHIFDTYAGLDGALRFAGGAGDEMGRSTAKARTFGKDADDLLGKFYENDLTVLLPNYFMGAARRAEQARRFGAKGADGSAERALWEKEHGEKTQLDVYRERMKADIERSGEDAAGALGVFDSIHGNNLGQVKALPKKMRETTAWMHTIGQLGTMDRATITSLSEAMMGFVRAGPRYGLPMLKNSAIEFGRQLRGAPKSDAARWAEAMGIATNAQANVALMARAGIEHSTMGAQKLLDKFYRGTMLHQWTEGTRTVATEMGRSFLRNLAGDLNSSSARVRSRADRYLAELGVTDTKAFGERMRGEGVTLEQALREGDKVAAEYSTALLRFVDQTIMRPTRAQKPGWSSHPLGSMMFSLMSYSYGFKKNVLDRTFRMGKRAIAEKDPTLLYPAFGLAGLTAVQGAMDTYVRPALFGSNYDFENETAGAAMLRVADRSGLTGAASPLINAVTGVRYDRSLTESLAGPVIGRPLDAATKIVEAAGARNTPNTNTAERNAAGALYDVMVEPALDAFAASRLKGIAATAGILGTGNRGEGGVLPPDREWFMDAVVGPKKPEKKKDDE